MERYDFECQNCGKHLGSAYGTVSSWHRCSQDIKANSLLEKTFMKYIKEKMSFVIFDEKGKITGGKISKKRDVLKSLENSLKEKDYKTSMVHGHYFFYIDFVKRKAWWTHEEESQFSEENHKRANLIKHNPANGIRYGYCFCENCSKKLKHKCPICGSKLIKIPKKKK